MSDQQKAEFYLLKIRSAVADKEFITACANHDLQRYGEWQVDYRNELTIAHAAIEAAEDGIRDL